MTNALSIALRLFANWLYRTTHYRGLYRVVHRSHDERQSGEFRAGVRYALDRLDLVDYQFDE